MSQPKNNRRKLKNSSQLPTGLTKHQLSNIRGNKLTGPSQQVLSQAPQAFVKTKPQKSNPPPNNNPPVVAPPAPPRPPPIVLDRGLQFTLPDRIQVESYPYYNIFYKLGTWSGFMYQLIKTGYKTLIKATMMLVDDKPITLKSAALTFSFDFLKLFALMCLYVQTHYLQPQANVCLQKQLGQPNQVIRHPNNQRTPQVDARFDIYQYEVNLELPVNHPIVRVLNWTQKGTTHIINTFVIPAIWATANFMRNCTPRNLLIYCGRKVLGFNDHQYIPFDTVDFGPSPQLPEVDIPAEVSLPPILRTTEMTKFYKVENGSIIPKTEVVNRDLLHRTLITKTLNYHVPIERQFQSLTAIVNNQSDVNNSDNEVYQPTATSTLTVLKFLALQHTRSTHELGFQEASAHLATSMDIVTSGSTRSGGHLSLQGPKTVLHSDAPTILTQGLLIAGLFSVALGATLVVLHSPTRIFLTQFLPFLVKLKDQLSEYLWWIREQSSSVTAHYILSDALTQEQTFHPFWIKTMTGLLLPILSGFAIFGILPLLCITLLPTSR